MTGSQIEQQQFYKQWAIEHWGLVDRLARRRFSSETLSEEAALYVMSRLETNDWELLRSYRGSARLKSYFSAVVYNLLEDFSRKKFGRVRPPGWLKRLGGAWLLLYQLLCLERYNYGEATSLAADRYQHLDQERIDLMADRILGEIPSCGKTQYAEVPLDERLHGAAAAQVSSQEVAEAQEREQVMKGLHDYFFGIDSEPSGSQPLSRLLGCQVELNPEERLLLTLCHVDGLSVAAAGKKLGLTRFQAHGKLRRLYGRLKLTFEEAGCGAELRQLLDTKS